MFGWDPGQGRFLGEVGPGRGSRKFAASSILWAWCEKSRKPRLGEVAGRVTLLSGLPGPCSRGLWPTRGEDAHEKLVQVIRVRRTQVEMVSSFCTELKV